MFSNYYSSDEVNDNAFSKAAGAVLWTGAAVGLVVLGHNKGTFNRIYDYAIHKGTNFFNSDKTKLGKAVAGSIDSVAETLFSKEANAVVEATAGVQSAIRTEKIVPERVDKFLLSLRERVAPGSLDTFDKRAEVLSGTLRQPLSATNAAESKTLVTSSDFIDRSMQLMDGIQFEAHKGSNYTREVYKEMFLTSVDSAYTVPVARRLSGVTDSPNNATTIQKAIEEAANKARKKDAFIDQVVSRSQGEQIMMRDFFTNDPDNEGQFILSELGKKFDAHVNKTQKYKGSFLMDRLKQFQESNSKLFSGDQESLANVTQDIQNIARKNFDRFMDSGTGIRKLGNDSFSSNRQIFDQSKMVKKMLNNLQIPLLPGVFDINLGSLYSFLREDDRLVRNLSRSVAQPELKRMGINHEGSYISVGDRILALTGPDRDQISMLDGKFKVLAKRHSTHIETMASNRSQAIQSPVDQIQEILSQEDIKHALDKSLAGDSHELTYIKKKLFANQHDYFTPVYKEGKLRAIPKQIAGGETLSAKVVQKLFGDRDVRLDELNFQNLQLLMDSEEVATNPTMLTEVSNAYLARATSKPVDLREVLQASADAVKDDLDSDIYDIISSLNDPEALYEVLESKGYFGADAAGILQHKPKLFQAVEYAKVDRQGFISSDFSEADGIAGVFQKLKGARDPSKLVLDLQMALLEDIQIAHGKAAMREAEILFDQNLDLVDTPKLRELLGNSLGISQGDPLESTQQAAALHTLTNSYLGNIGRAGDDQMYHVNQLYKAIGSSRVTSSNQAQNAKLLGSQAELLTSLQNQQIQRLPRYPNEDPLVQLTTRKIHEISIHQDVTTTINKRFNSYGGRGFSPYNPPIDISSGSDYYAIPKAEGLINNVTSTFKGIVDPHSPFSVSSYTATVLGQMSNKLAQEAGFGLPQQDQITLLRTFAGYGVRRALPLMIGLEAYKNYNSDMERIGLPGIDDVGANAIANLNLATASIKDFLGITDVVQSFVASVPGLDMFFSPRSREEYEEYLAYGNEAVRKGRGWLIGNRGFFMGGGIDHYRPNFYRRWTSNWTYHSGVSDNDYSPLPSLTNPLGPLQRFFVPSWEQKYGKDRPYAPNGISAELNSKQNLVYQLYGGGLYALNQGTGRVLNDNERLSEGYAVGVGEGGGGEQNIGAVQRIGEGSPLGGFATADYSPYDANNEYSLSLGITDSFKAIAQQYQSQSGLYGSFGKVLGLQSGFTGLRTQQRGDAVGPHRFLYGGQYGEALGPFGEFFRRVFGFPQTSTFDTSPYYNQAPTWLPERFSKGDMYLNTRGIGELLLPGDAFEAANPWVRPMKVRGSMIGLSAEEMMHKILDPMSLGQGEEDDLYMEYGSYAHKEAQRQLDAAGLLVAAEVPIYDHVNNISGTLDAVIRGEGGKHYVNEIKTQSGRQFEEGVVHEKYIDQLTFYMHTTNTEKGYLTFINSDNPSQVRVEEIMYDPERFDRILSRIDQARSGIQKLIDGGVISPYEVYDPLARLAVLGKVAPNSAEYERLVSKMTGGFNAQESLIFDRIKDEANELKKGYNTYAYRNITTRSIRARVISINKDGTITTTRGTIRPAGIELDRQAFIYEDPEELYGRLAGITVGSSIVFDINGGLDPDTMAHTVFSAVIPGLKQALIGSGYGKDVTDSDDPLDFHDNKPGTVFEKLLHADTLINNKFFRVRSALEQYERGEVFGTDFASWSEPIDTYLVPTLHSFISKASPIGGVQAAITTSLFFKETATKVKAGAVVGAAVAGISLARSGYEFLTGDTWTPSDHKKQGEIDEYYDILEYIKQSSLAIKATRDAYVLEGVNLMADPDQESKYSFIIGRAEENAKGTMYAFNVMEGTLQEALDAIPRRKRQLAEEIIMYASKDEKDRFFELLPASEQRVLGKFLVDDLTRLPDRPELQDYFTRKFLPDPNWRGWEKDIDLDAVARVASSIEDTNRSGASPADRALVEGSAVNVPRMDNPYAINIKQQIMKLASTMNIPVEIDIRSSSARESLINLAFSMELDNSALIQNNLQQDMRRSN